MTQLKGWSMTGDPETFHQRAAAFQHGRNLAKEWRNGFIEAANWRVSDLNSESQSFASSGEGPVFILTAGPVLVESDTSANETEAEYENALQWSFTDHVGEVDEEEEDTIGASKVGFKRQRVGDKADEQG
ncbi:predicted protein [Histoplasma mississippiense (nom. inval.)]|nr:predicted protein [Histoplasma mississippiense (nom. inval.)]EDN07451.1 predicted protein [Histoplasma mississippiense (nom. inval.)]